MARPRSQSPENLTPPKRASSPTMASSPADPPSNSKVTVATNPVAEESEPRGATETKPESSNTVVAPTPCERCARTSKVCRGQVGARCDYCKRLKQKCSNSTGPARGKHASAARLAANGVAPMTGAPKPPQPAPLEADVLAAQRGYKRRFDDIRQGSSYLSDSREEEEEDEDDGHEPPAKFNKKRRTASSSAMIASRVLRHVKELEATVKRLEDTYNKEMERVDSIISRLTKDMTDLTDDRDSASL